MKNKRDKRDTVFSLLTRERAGNVCERCGKNGSDWVLHCSHIFSRRHRRLRWHPDNSQCLCFTCHKWWHENPVESGIWIREFLGEGFMELLEEKKNMIAKYSKPVLQDIYKHLGAEYSRMMDLRADGETGRIEFEAFD